MIKSSMNQLVLTISKKELDYLLHSNYSDEILKHKYPNEYEFLSIFHKQDSLFYIPRSYLTTVLNTCYHYFKKEHLDQVLVMMSK